MSGVKFIGLKDLKRAVRNHPRTVKRAAHTYLTRAIAEYKRGIINDPWRVGGRGGGAPVSNDPRYRNQRNKGYQRARSGNLRDTHITRIQSLQASIGPNTDAAPYARYVHGGTRRMKARPWLDYVKDEKSTLIRSHYRQMLKTISRSLAR